MITRNIKSGLVAGAFVLIALFGMSLNVGGTTHLLEIVGGFWFVFLITALSAFFIGWFISNFKLRWSALLGIVIGLSSGFGILLFVTSNI